jgi:hypothetical protein
VDTETLKQRLLVACSEHVESRIDISKQSMELAQQAANEEGKSSAGDKYETGRAMMQIERDQAARQLDEALKLRNTLDQIPTHANTTTVGLGSLVITSTKKIFISIGIGKLNLDGEDFLVVAPASPLGKALMGLKQKDKIVFNNETLVIEEVC